MAMISPVSVDRAFVLAKCSFFVDVQLWPILENVDPESWLSNFRPDEMDHALQLLNGFMYLSEPVTDAIFAASVQRLSRLVVGIGKPFHEAQRIWKAFLQTSLFTFVTGESPNPSDSGHIFVRKARDVIRVPEDNIIPPDAALEILIRDGVRPVIFVDDFLGTGNQFVETWRRQVAFGDTRVRGSFESVASVRGGTFYYCPAVATTAGIEQLRTHCPSVVVSAGNVMSSRHSVISPDSVVWPEEMKDSGPEFVEAVSKRAGIPDTGGLTPEDWRGFGGLALPLAFAHGVPDATLRLFTWKENGWIPLKRVS